MDDVLSLVTVTDGELRIVGEATVTFGGQVTSVKFLKAHDNLKRVVTHYRYKYYALPEPHVLMTAKEEVIA